MKRQVVGPDLEMRAPSAEEVDGWWLAPQRCAPSAPAVNPPPVMPGPSVQYPGAPPPPFPAPGGPVEPAPAAVPAASGKAPSEPVDLLTIARPVPSRRPLPAPPPPFPRKAGTSPTPPPRSIEHLETIELETPRDPAEAREPVRTSTQEICVRCGSPAYPTLGRCPRCMADYAAGRSGASAIRRRPPPGRLGRTLRSPVVALTLLVALVGGLGALYYFVLSQRDLGAVPGETVSRFYDALTAGRLAESVEYLHPRHQPAAARIVRSFIRAQQPVTELARQIFRAPDQGQFRIVAGSRRALGENRWEVKLVVRAGAQVVSQRWIPVSRVDGVWYLDANPYQRLREERETRRKLAVLPAPGPVLSGPPLPKN